MSGYTPVFGTLFQGSLCGQWPALPLFCTLLPLADKHGEIDLSFGYLAATTGWPEDLLRQGIEQLEQPDPHSRSPDDDGRRLVRLRDNTEWGWRIVNHGKYREKARLAAKNAVDVATGKEAGRKRYSRTECPPVSAGARRSPPVSDPSYANANANADIGTTTVALRPAKDDPPEFAHIRSAYPKRGGSQPWPRALKAAQARIREGDTWTDLLDGVSRYAEFVRATGKEGTEYVLQAATFFGPDKRYLEPWAAPATKADARYSANVSTARTWAEGQS